MIKQLCKHLYVGSTAGLIFTNKDWFIVSTAQTLHYYYLGWTLGLSNKNSKHYLYHHFNNKLTINWVDGPKHLFSWYTPDIFKFFLDLIEEKYKQQKVFIHCDQGLSRSPTLCLLFMAKRLNLISNLSAEHAFNDFIKIYPQYGPGGIFEFISENWEKLI